MKEKLNSPTYNSIQRKETKSPKIEKVIDPPLKKQDSKVSFDMSENSNFYQDSYYKSINMKTTPAPIT